MLLAGSLWNRSTQRRSYHEDRTYQVEVVKLEKVAVVATRDDRLRIDGMPDDTPHRGLEQQAIQKASLQSIPDDEGVIVATAGKMGAVRGERQIVDSVAVAGGEGVSLDIGSIRMRSRDSHSVETTTGSGRAVSGVSGGLE